MKPTDSPARPKRPVVWVAMGHWVEPIFLGIAKYAAEHGWVLNASMSWLRGPVSAPKQRPDGVIVFTGSTPGLEDAVKACGAPVVDLENYRDLYGAPKIVGDDFEVGVIAARHLGAYAPRQLAYAGVKGATGETSRLRAKGFRTEAARMGIAVKEFDGEEFDPRKVLRGGSCGVFACSDHTAYSLLLRCLDAGVAVPDDIAILGADDTEFICALAPVPLSSVNMDFERKGRAAAEVLDALMRGEKTPAKPVVVPPRGATARESTRAMRSGDAETDRLVRHLRENSRRHVRVETLCEELGVPLRTAQHRLRLRLGVSPSELLTRFRLENAETLESLGTLKAEAIAKASGFGSRSALLRAKRAART